MKSGDVQINAIGTLVWNLRLYGSIARFCFFIIMKTVSRAPSRDFLVRTSAAEALGEIKDSRVIEPLTAAMKDEDSNVRKSAAEALGKINDN